MRLAVSNISLPAYEHAHYFKALAELGVTGLEVAPSRVWADTWQGLTAKSVDAYRRAAEEADLTITGLHSLFFDQPNLTIFGDTETTRRTASFFEHLSGLCRDLGGRVLVFGSPSARKMEDMGHNEAMAIAGEFFSGLSNRIKGHGTLICVEPLAPNDTGFCNSLTSIAALRDAVGHTCMGIQIDARALTANNEMTATHIDAVRDGLVHVHANASDLGVLSRTDTIDHDKLGSLLRNSKYNGFVSLEQRMLDADTPLDAVAHSLEIMKAAYL